MPGTQLLVQYHLLPLLLSIETFSLVTTNVARKNNDKSFEMKHIHLLQSNLTGN